MKKILICYVISMIIFFYTAFLLFRWSYNYVSNYGLKGVVEKVWEGDKK